jgi:hypothetical protein
MGTNVFATLDEARAWVQSKLDNARVLEQANG